jgi:hypothetical protein
MTTNFSTAYMTDAEACIQMHQNNQVMASNELMQLIDPFNLTSPDFLPSSASPLLNGASFMNPGFADSFFTPASYRGAFGATDWTSGWCNFNPQNADY